MLHAVSKESDADKSLEIFIGHYAYLRKLIHTFGENGEIPDGWLCKYAFITMKNAQGLFSSGRTDEGFELLEIAVNSYKKYFDLPDDTPLSLGAPAFFGDITVKKYTIDGKNDVYTDGIEASYYMQNPIYLYDILNGDSDCFADVRSDPRFLNALSGAKELADEFLKKRAK